MHFSSQIKCFNQKNPSTLENLHMLPKLPLFATPFLTTTVYLMDAQRQYRKTLGIHTGSNYESHRKYSLQDVNRNFGTSMVSLPWKH